jgi:hypothetical protein
MGEPLPTKGQPASGPVRCTKDLLEERLFDHRRDLFTEVESVFFDTTILYFEGQGGESLSQRGHSKDHRPDLRQMVVGLALDVQGEKWPRRGSEEVKSGSNSCRPHKNIRVTRGSVALGVAVRQ